MRVKVEDMDRTYSHLEQVEFCLMERIFQEKNLFVEVELVVDDFAVSIDENPMK